MGNDDIFVAANLLENFGLEFRKVGFSALRLEVSCYCSFKIAETLSNVKWGLVRHPFAINLYFLNWFLIVCVCIVIGEMDLQIEISIKLLDNFINVILADGFLRNGDKF